MRLGSGLDEAKTSSVTQHLQTLRKLWKCQVLDKVKHLAWHTYFSTLSSKPLLSHPSESSVPTGGRRRYPRFMGLLLCQGCKTVTIVKIFVVMQSCSINVLEVGLGCEGAMSVHHLGFLVGSKQVCILRVF